MCIFQSGAVIISEIKRLRLRLVFCSAVHGTDVHYETQPVIYALWPNFKILAPRRLLLASSHYCAVFRFIHHIW